MSSEKSQTEKDVVTQRGESRLEREERRIREKKIASLQLGREAKKRKAERQRAIHVTQQEQATTYAPQNTEPPQSAPTPQSNFTPNENVRLLNPMAILCDVGERILLQLVEVFAGLLLSFLITMWGPLFISFFSRLFNTGTGIPTQKNTKRREYGDSMEGYENGEDEEENESDSAREWDR